MRQLRRQREQQRAIHARIQRRARAVIARAGDTSPELVDTDREGTCWFYVKRRAADRLVCEGGTGWTVYECDERRGRVFMRFWARLGRWVGASLRYRLTSPESTRAT